MGISLILMKIMNFCKSMMSLKKSVREEVVQFIGVNLKKQMKCLPSKSINLQMRNLLRTTKINSKKINNCQTIAL